MPIKDQVKNLARKLVERKPTSDALRASVRAGMSKAYFFAEDGIVPNHPRWPLVVHRSAVNSRAVLIQRPSSTPYSRSNGWTRSWRDSIYDFLHYHSQTHEALGVARGNATVEFGGIKGKRLQVRAGDIVILPAGTGHRLIHFSRTFLVVGAYPPDGTYDECTDTRELLEAKNASPKSKSPGAIPSMAGRPARQSCGGQADVDPDRRPDFSASSPHRSSSPPPGS